MATQRRASIRPGWRGIDRAPGGNAHYSWHITRSRETCQRHSTPNIWQNSRRGQIILCDLIIYRIKFFLTFFGNFLDAIGPLIVLAVGGWLVMRGGVEIGTLVVFISGFQKLADPWDQLTNFYRMLSTARAKYRLIADTLPDGSTPAR
jgi:ABC-type multidrug transport system fused ATPase/permease subunit